MLIPMSTVHALEALSVDLVVGGIGEAANPGALLNRIRSKAVSLLNEAAGPVVNTVVDLDPADVIFEPARTDPDGRSVWRCRWSPEKPLVELWGGPKDGATMLIPSLRPDIRFRMLAPGAVSAFRAAGDPDAVVAKIDLVYELEAYETRARHYVYRYHES